MKSKILLVDDEPFFLAVLSGILIDKPYEVHTASSAEQAREIMCTHRFKVVISDECMKGIQGSEFLFYVRQHYPDTIRILLTGNATIKTAMNAINQGEIYRFLTKSCNENEILFAVQSSIEKFDLEFEHRRLLSTLTRQSLELKVLERRFPGITRAEKDEHGNFILNDMSEAEIRRMMSTCEREIQEELERD